MVRSICQRAHYLLPINFVQLFMVLSRWQILFRSDHDTDNNGSDGGDAGDIAPGSAASLVTSTRLTWLNDPQDMGGFIGRLSALGANAVGASRPAPSSSSAAASAAEGASSSGRRGGVSLDGVSDRPDRFPSTSSRVDDASAQLPTQVGVMSGVMSGVMGW